MDINKFETLKKTRENLLNSIAELTAEQLNEIPAGFNNNIIWNVAHLTAVQQGICYGRAGLPKKIEDVYFDLYKPDTKPQGALDGAEIEKIKRMFLSVVGELEADYQKNVFTTYTTWSNRFGVEVKNIDEGLNFLLFHEGLHRGYVMALKRLVKK